MVVQRTRTARPTATPPRILIIGGGHVGLNVANRLERLLRPGEAELILVDPLTYMTYQPLLAEVAAGNVEPRHITVPLRWALPRFHVVHGEVLELRHADRTAHVELVDSGDDRDIGYDHVVVCPGGAVRTLPVPGLAELAVGFRTIAEAVFLRNQVLTQLSVAASSTDPGIRRAALTFVVVGGGYAGVEALGELSDLSRAVAPVFELRPDDVRWILVEASDRLMPEVKAQLSACAASMFRGRGVELRLGTTTTSCVAGRIRFGPGRYADDVVETHTLVWATGSQPNPMLECTDLPRDGLGRVLADAYLRVQRTPGAWTAGDCAAVPDLASREPGALCLPTAQHAIRQARRLADNLVAELRGERRHPPRPYRHRFVGSVAGIGRFQGVAQVYGVCLTGLPAWLLHRAYHLTKLPSATRRRRVLADWILDALSPRDISALTELEQPRSSLQATARGAVAGISGV